MYSTVLFTAHLCYLSSQCSSGGFMKQIRLNSKWSLPALVAIFVSAGRVQDIVKDDKPLRSIVLASGDSYCCGADFWSLFRKWLSCVAQITLFCTLAISGCTSKNSGEYSGGHGQQKPQEQSSSTAKPDHKEVGEASWYGPGFHGKETASGETFDQKDMTAAHPSLPMGSVAKVTNLENGKKVEVRINDRGPFKGDRAIDLSSAAANKIDMKKGGTTQVKIESKSKATKNKKFAKHAKKTRAGKKATLRN